MTVQVLADHIQKRQSCTKGFPDRKLWRMMQFHEIYRERPNPSALHTELSWTHNLLILGKLEFYLETLDLDVKRSHERSSIGVLLCATKDNEVVEYTQSRASSPALVAEYQTRLPDKGLLQAKLHEFHALARLQTTSPPIESPIIAC